MGCTESLPEPNAFEQVHHVDKKIAPLGSSVPGAMPSMQGSTQIIVREKLFSWSGDTFKIKTKAGLPFHGIMMQGKTFALRDCMTLLDANGKPLAVCLRKFEVIGETFKIYRTEPLFAGQKPSDRRHDNGIPLYTYCKVERVPFSPIQNVTFDNEQSPSYTIHRAGGLWPKQRVVKRYGMPAARMEGGTWDGSWNSYLLTINPGIDPCLIICLAAICDEMDED